MVSQLQILGSIELDFSGFLSTFQNPFDFLRSIDEFISEPIPKPIFIQKFIRVSELLS